MPSPTRSCVLVVGLVLLTIGVLAAGSAMTEGARDVELNALDEETTRTVAPSNPAIFNLSIQYSGDASSVGLIVDLIGEPSGWRHMLTVSTGAGIASSALALEFSLGRWEIAPMFVSITPSADALAGAYPLSVSARSKDDPATYDLVNVTVEVTQSVGFDILLWDPPAGNRFQALPPAEVRIRFVILNTGNGVDDFQADLDVQLPTDEWNATITSGTDVDGWTGEMPPDPLRSSPHFVEVVVRMPEGAEAGSLCLLELGAASRSDPSFAVPQAYAIIMALTTHGLEAEFVGADEIRLHPGQSYAKQLLVQNLGNWEETFDIIVSADWHDAWLRDVSLSNESLTIGSGSSGLTMLVLQVRTDAIPGTHPIDVMVKSTTEDGLNATLHLMVTVLVSYSTSLTCPSGWRTTGPGGNASYSVSVNNHGNTQVSYSMSVADLPHGWTCEIRPLVVSVAPRTSSVVWLNVTTPATPMDRSGRYEFNVTADGDGGLTSGSAPLALEVGPVTDVEWWSRGAIVTSPDSTAAMLSDIYLNPATGETINPLSGLAVANLGNAPILVRLEVTTGSSDLFLELPSDLMEVPYGGIADVRAELEWLPGLDLGEYELTLRFLVSGNSSFEARTVWLRLVAFYQDLEIVNLTASGLGLLISSHQPGEVEEWTRMQISFGVWNRRPDTALQVRVQVLDVAPDGSAVEVLNRTCTVGLGERYGLTASWTARGIGNHSLIARAMAEGRPGALAASDDIKVTVKERDRGASNFGVPPRTALAVVVLVVLLLLLVLLMSELRTARAKASK